MNLHRCVLGIISSFTFFGACLAGGGLAGCGEDEPLNLMPSMGGAASDGAGAAGGATGSWQTDEDAVIDDFEDKDLNLLARDGRQGTWFGYDDTTDTGELITLANVRDGAEHNRMLHVTGDGFSSWGGGIVGILNGNAESSSYTDYDGSLYTGITFRARWGAGTGVVRFGLADGNTEPGGGVCTACYDHFGADLVLDEDWETYSFDFTELTQLGWGDGFPSLDPSRLIYLMFQVGSATEMDLYLDDVAFLTDGPRISVETGGAGGTGGTSGLDASGGNVPYDSLAPAVERYGQLQVVDGKLCAADGSPAQLKGVSSMWLNWERNGYAESAAALEWMRDRWGLEVIRAAMGVDASDAYLADPDHALGQVRTIIDNALESGVYVIVDWHSHHAEDYQSEAEEFFSALAEEYGEYPNLIWEPYNEPLAVAWSQTLKPYHEAVIARIREHDPNNVIVLGTPNWSQDVDVAATDPVAGGNLMYTLHFYACTHRASLRSKAEAALTAGLALFVTEWGATAADGGLDGRVCESEAEAWHTWMDARDISWTAWKLDNCTPDSTCLLTPSAPVDGGWTNEFLQGHAPLVRAHMRVE